VIRQLRRAQVPRGWPMRIAPLRSVVFRKRQEYDYGDTGIVVMGA
jgi:hypothetical protein